MAAETETQPKKKRGRAALGSGWDWLKGQLSDSKMLATIAGVVATGLAIAGLAINQAELERKIGVLQTPAPLQPVVDRLGDVEGAVSALRAKDPVALFSPRVEELAEELGGLEALLKATPTTAPATTTTTTMAPAAAAFDPAPIVARLDSVDKKLATLSDQLAAEEKKSTTLAGALEAVKADVATARAAIETLRSELTGKIAAVQADLDTTKKKLTAGTQLPTNSNGQVTWCFGAGRFTQKPFLSAVVHDTNYGDLVPPYVPEVWVANAGCATVQVWQITASGPVKAGANLLVNLMAVQP